METKGYELKLLITGASGLLGSRLCELAIRKNHEVYSAYSQHKPLIGKPIQLDVSNKNDVETTFNLIKPEAVVHSAALTDVDKCELKKEMAWKINVEGTKNIAESSGKNQIFLVYVSTDYVFDGEKGMYEETDEPAPINYYGLTKLKGEEAVQALDNYSIARGSVIYGSTPAIGKTNFALWLLEKLKREETVNIAIDQWNSPTLNANMAAMILETLERRLNGIFHLAGATRLSRYEFAKHLAQTFNLDRDYIKPVQSNHFKWVANRPKDSSLNVNMAKRTLAIKPLEIQEALQIMKKETD
jgi:dTDP-4-dehydrorhamnose reductase